LPFIRELKKQVKHDSRRRSSSKNHASRTGGRGANFKNSIERGDKSASFRNRPNEQSDSKKSRAPRLTPKQHLELYHQEHKIIVGTFIKGDRGGSFIIPDDERLGAHVDVKLISNNGKEILAHAISGQKVVANFGSDFEDTGKVNVIEVLGEADSKNVDTLSIIRSYNLYEEFSNEVMNEAKTVAKLPSKTELDRRTNLRESLIITIDPADAHDLDDAISLTKRGDGGFELGVHIADVSHYVTRDGELDKEAYKRGTSVYFPDKVLPMLPPQLSNDICSLNPNVDRLTLSVFMTIDKNGDVTAHQIQESVIHVKQRFSYNQVQAILDAEDVKASAKNGSKSVKNGLQDVENGGVEGQKRALEVQNSHPLEKPKTELPKISKPTLELIKNAAELAQILERARKARGEVIFDVPEPKIVLDPETGKIVDVIAQPHHLSHRIIESFMVLCNETVAREINELDLPFIYRVHEKPDPIKVAKLGEMLKPFGILTPLKPDSPTSHQYQKMLLSIDESIKPIVSQLALRSMQKARYFQQCLGHFGLASKYYCHFTSPIRRYPDLVIHRIIKQMLGRKMSSHDLSELEGFVALASEQSSKMERLAVEAEREVNNLKRAQYMQDQIGEVFSGVISGIMDFGVFVYLPNTVEGLIKIENMPKDHYNFNEKQGILVGRKRTFKMGDAIDVLCVGVNMARRRVEFAAVAPQK